ncbi:MAG: hypothetical protein ACI83P_002671 [Janthinobacterium sp.]|jgi:hypothetical protein
MIGAGNATRECLYSPLSPGKAASDDGGTGSHETKQRVTKKDKQLHVDIYQNSNRFNME